jgi:hypothetical protein
MGWGRYRGCSVGSFTEAAGVLKKRETKKVANNTYVVRTDSEDTLALLYHRTKIIYWNADGSIVLNSGGWQTYSTKERLNSFSPQGFYRDGEWVGFAIQVWQQLGNWYVSIRTESGIRRTVPFHDHMQIFPQGCVQVDGEPIPDADVEGDRRTYLRTKAAQRRENLRQGLVWQGRGRFGGWRQPGGDPRFSRAAIPPAAPSVNSLRDEIAWQLDERDRAWRAAQMRRVTDDPTDERANYVPEFAKGNGKA